MTDWHAVIIGMNYCACAVINLILGLIWTHDESKGWRIAGRFAYAGAVFCIFMTVALIYYRVSQ